MVNLSKGGAGDCEGYDNVRPTGSSCNYNNQKSRLLA